MPIKIAIEIIKMLLKIIKMATKIIKLRMPSLPGDCADALFVREDATGRFRRIPTPAELFHLARQVAVETRETVRGISLLFRRKTQRFPVKCAQINVA